MKNNFNLTVLIIRLTVGILMLFHGIAKIKHGVDGLMPLLSAKGIPTFIAYGVIVGEVIAPILIIVGFRLRLASIVLAINMIIAIALAHSGDVFKLSNHGAWALELQGFYLFLSIALFFSGAGKYSISNKNKWD